MSKFTGSVQVGFGVRFDEVVADDAEQVGVEVQDYLTEILTALQMGRLAIRRDAVYTTGYDGEQVLVSPATYDDVRTTVLNSEYGIEDVEVSSTDDLEQMPSTYRVQVSFTWQTEGTATIEVEAADEDEARSLAVSEVENADSLESLEYGDADVDITSERCEYTDVEDVEEVDA